MIKIPYLGKDADNGLLEVVDAGQRLAGRQRLWTFFNLIFP
jgi:hypothetical protein